MSIQWSLIIFSLVAGAGGALLGFVGLGSFKNLENKVRFRMVLVGIALLIIGGLASVAHLKSPTHFMSAITHLGSFSGISIELMLIGCLIVAGFLLLIAVSRENANFIKVMGVICMVLGVLFAFFSGEGYVLEARAGWHTFFVPLCYMTSSLAAGGFIGIVFVKAEEIRKMYGLATLGISALAVFFCIAYGIYALSAVSNVNVIYFVLAAAGAALSAVSSYLVAYKQANDTWVYIGLVGAIVCGICIRMFMWASGENMFDAFDTAIWNRGYFVP